MYISIGITYDLESRDYGNSSDRTHSLVGLSEIVDEIICKPLYSIVRALA